MLLFHDPNRGLELRGLGHPGLLLQRHQFRGHCISTAAHFVGPGAGHRAAPAIHSLGTNLQKSISCGNKQRKVGEESKTKVVS